MKQTQAQTSLFSEFSDSVPYDLPERKGWCGLALVGEAPGAEEARQGHPFVGRSGKLLDGLLEKAEIKRSNCLIANVFRVQPPKNKVDHFFMSRRAAKAEGVKLNEKLGPFGSALCRDAFTSEINALSETLHQWKPDIIIALGRTPFWALTGENGLLANVGKTFPCRLLEGVSVLPTYHPSFILRGNWALQDQWLEHILAAKQQLRRKSA